MINVIATHAVGDMEKWLAGGAARDSLFSSFCSSYRIYRHASQRRVAIAWDNVDMARFEAVLTHPDAARAEAENTVIRPVDIFVEVAGGR